MQAPSESSTKEGMKSAAPLRSTAAPAAASAPPSSSSSAMSPSPTVSHEITTPDERLALALKHLGAQHGPRGDVLRLTDVSFRPGQAQFTRGTGGDLDKVAALLRDYPKVRLIVDGYTDNRGSEQLNERLSLQRAKSVQQALAADGVESTRLRTRGLAATVPIADDDTRQGRDENRRVELVFSNSAGTFASAHDQTTDWRIARSR
jgi:outer membrane protein OmpA-like peptidoglycan-associated protein